MALHSRQKNGTESETSIHQFQETSGKDDVRQAWEVGKDGETAKPSKPPRPAPKMSIPRLKAGDPKSFLKGTRLMGTAWRSAITGQVRIRGVHFPDFSLVDLFTRPEIAGTNEAIAKDWYLFRPRPLAYRTWMYHYMYDAKLIPPPQEDDKPENLDIRLLRYVFHQQCVDKDVSAGLWSPVMPYTVLSLSSALSGDLLLLCVSTAVLFMIYLITVSLSIPEAYKWQRLVSLPLRTLYAGVLGWRIIFILGYGHIFGYIGSFLSIVALLGDFIAGDFRNLISKRYECTYEIVRALPNRVFIVRQHGGAIGFDKTETPEFDTWSFDQRAAIMGSLQRELRVIADIEGIIVELRPATIDDIFTISQENMHSLIHTSKQMHRFIGLDVFFPGAPSVHDLAEWEEKQKEELVRQLQAKSEAQPLKLEDAEAVPWQSGFGGRPMTAS